MKFYFEYNSSLVLLISHILFIFKILRILSEQHQLRNLAKKLNSVVFHYYLYYSKF